MRKGRADGRLPMLTVVVTQALFFHQFWRGYPLAEYRFIMRACGWVWPRFRSLRRDLRRNFRTWTENSGGTGRTVERW